jgi:hypothetical protein
MQLSSAAQDFRNLSNKLQQISEYNTSDDTQEPDVEITDTELSRLKLALRPLVSDELQSRFMQVLNKMVSGQPITFAESKLITSAFISMSDIIASDSSLISRLRKDIKDVNDEAAAQETSDEYSPEIGPTDFESEPEEVEPTSAPYQPK